MILNYKLTFLDYWHLGSGLSAGAKLDSSVVKDDDGVPYASGKTIKGLVREMALELNYDCQFLDGCFGSTSDKDDVCYKRKSKLTSGKYYFTNATLDQTIKEEIVANRLQDNLYDVIASTQLKDGLAVDDSLREIEVVIPLTLEGKIMDIESEEDCKKLTKSLKMIKRMGLNRNRGLGRCTFEVECIK
jgi:hypothetical protein